MWRQVSIRQGKYRGRDAFFIRVPNHRGEVFIGFNPIEVFYWGRYWDFVEGGDSLNVEFPRVKIKILYEGNAPLGYYSEK